MDFDITYLIFPFTIGGIPLLALAGIGGLLYSKGKDRRNLAWTAAVFLAALALYFGGSIALGCFRMTWRNLPSMVLLGTLLVSGWVGIVLTLVCVLPMEWPNVPRFLRWSAKGVLVLFAAVVLLATLRAGPLALVFDFGNEERKVEYQGQLLLEENDGFLDPHYSYYKYYGPLARGTERIMERPDPYLE